jgi:hypothetical protein
MEEYRLLVPENRAVNRISGFKTDEVTGGVKYSTLQAP